MNCTICTKPIILVPSAQERSAKDITGRPASFYTNLFTSHTHCFLQKQKQETLELMKRLRGES